MPQVHYSPLDTMILLKKETVVFFCFISLSPPPLSVCKWNMNPRRRKGTKSYRWRRFQTYREQNPDSCTPNRSLNRRTLFPRGCTIYRSVLRIQLVLGRYLWNEKKEDAFNDKKMILPLLAWQRDKLFFLFNEIWFLITGFLQVCNANIYYFRWRISQCYCIGYYISFS